MGLWQGFVDRIRPKANVKGVTFIPADGDLGGALPRSSYSYGSDIRHGFRSNAVMAPVHWICRNFTQADAIVEIRKGNAYSEVVDHPLKVLLDNPNDFYDGDLLWRATLISYLLDGNAYWRKIRNTFGEVIQLWYLPHFLVAPKSPEDGSAFISHYEYRPTSRGFAVKIPVRDIIHFKPNLDPRDPRLGMGVLKPLMREIFTDEEASNFSASILRNMGVPGGVLSPKEAGSLPTPDDVEEMKNYMRTEFTGDRRGEWFVTTIPTEVKQFGFDPSQLLVTNLRDITEERVCAMLGIPAAVVGFGAGLQQTKVGATMRELREEAWTSGIAPRHRNLGRAVSKYLLPEFQAQEQNYRMRFDTSKVPALMQLNADLQGQMVKDGIQRVDHAQAALGIEVDDSQAVYLRPSTTQTVPAGETPPAATLAVDESQKGLNRIRELLAQENGGNDE